MSRTYTSLAALLAVGVFLSSPVLAQQSRPSPQVFVYSTYFEADGMRFDSIEELRNYLLNAPNDFYLIFIRDCAVKGREQELGNVIFGVLAERRARRGAEGPVNLGIGSIPCP